MTHLLSNRLQRATAAVALLAVCGLPMLVASGCRSLAPGGAHVHPQARRAPAPQAYDVAAEGCYVNGVEEMTNALYPDGIPLPQIPITPWAPPGIELPWPHDEYLHDGGDRNVQVTVTASDTINGLELEDTIVYGDTIDDRKIIEPSNRVCLYAPRFGAVRKVTGVQQNLHSDQPIGVMLPIKPELEKEDLPPLTAVQPLQPVGEIGLKQPSIERLRQYAGVTGNRMLPGIVDNVYKAYENFQVIRIGIVQDAEKARLAESLDAAITWSHDQAVQVILEKQNAVVATGDERAQATYRVDVPNHPCLRVIKCASRQVALPGDIVDFTIRFDNMGDQAIGNVTLVDNLTTRLEFVPDSAQSSRQAEFMTQPNEGDSLVLRWEFVEPLGVGEGGIVRFQCKVR